MLTDIVTQYGAELDENREIYFLSLSVYVSTSRMNAAVRADCFRVREALGVTYFQFQFLLLSAFIACLTEHELQISGCLI